MIRNFIEDLKALPFNIAIRIIASGDPDAKLFIDAAKRAERNGDGNIVITPEGGQPIRLNFRKGLSGDLSGLTKNGEIDVQITDKWGNRLYHRTRMWGGK